MDKCGCGWEGESSTVSGDIPFVFICPECGVELPTRNNTDCAAFTEDDIDSCWAGYKTYLLDILNGEYNVEEARDDLRGLIGSPYDPRA